MNFFITQFYFQGIFVFKNGLSIKSHRKIKKSSSEQLVNQENEGQEWYLKFKRLWRDVEKKIEVRNRKTKG
jgi:hypothetical protein